MKFYLANARINRKEVREWELGFEKRTGINLINPFFDKDAPEEELNHLENEKYLLISKEEKNSLVEGDKKAIASPEVDGIIAFITCKSWGTAMEIIYASQLQKKVYLIVKNGDENHPWLVSHSTRIFTSEEEFEKYIIYQKS